MADETVQMTAKIPQPGSAYIDPAFEYSETLRALGNTKKILIPMTCNTVSVSLSFTGGAKGKVQACIDLLDNIRAGTETWVDWPDGEISTAMQATCNPPASIRAVMTDAGTAGTLKFSIVGQ